MIDKTTDFWKVPLMTKNIFVLGSLILTTIANAGGIVPVKTLHQERMTIQSTKTDAAPKVLYFGGPVISAVKIVSVFWGSKVNPIIKNGIDQFYVDVTNSTYMDWLNNEYNTSRKTSDGSRDGTGQSIGRGMLFKSVVINPINTAVKLDKVDVEAEIVKQIANNSLPAPDANTLYMIAFPKGITLTTGGIASCQAWCGDHEGFTDPKYGNIYYAMMPDLTGACQFGCSYGSNMLDSFTNIASHEIIEAITDPMCPNIGQDGGYPAAWLSADQNEVGDLCTTSKATLKVGSKTYAVQGEWQNSTNSCKGGTYTGN